MNNICKIKPLTKYLKRNKTKKQYDKFPIDFIQVPIEDQILTLHQVRLYNLILY